MPGLCNNLKIIIACVLEYYFLIVICLSFNLIITYFSDFKLMMKIPNQFN